MPSGLADFIRLRCVSRRKNSATPNDTAPSAAAARNTSRHENASRTAFPTAGPAIGAKHCVIARIENAQRMRFGSNASVTTAREITTGAQPKNAWKNRITQRNSMLRAFPQSTEETVNSTSEIRIGNRRPNASLAIPQTSCPTAKPPRNTESEICTCACVAFKACEISPNEEMYESMQNGSSVVMSVRTASMIISFLVILHSVCFFIASPYSPRKLRERGLRINFRQVMKAARMPFKNPIATQNCPQKSA